jgi:hypothetical protein
MSELNKNVVCRENIVNFREKNMLALEHTYLDSLWKKMPYFIATTRSAFS